MEQRNTAMEKAYCNSCGHEKDCGCTDWFKERLLDTKIAVLKVKNKDLLKIVKDLEPFITKIANEKVEATPFVTIDGKFSREGKMFLERIQKITKDKK